MKVAALSLNPWPSTSSQLLMLLGNSKCIHWQSQIHSFFHSPGQSWLCRSPETFNPSSPPSHWLCLPVSPRKYMQSEDDSSKSYHHMNHSIYIYFVILSVTRDGPARAMLWFVHKIPSFVICLNIQFQQLSPLRHYHIFPFYWIILIAGKHSIISSS